MISDAQWYPQSNISDCCSLDYDLEMRKYKDNLKNEIYNFKNGSAIKAIGNIVMDFVQGIYYCNIEQ